MSDGEITMMDRETDIDRIGDGGATAIVSGLLIAVLTVVALFYFFGGTRPGSDTIDIQPPKLVTNATPAG